MKICMICPEIGHSDGKAFIGGHVNNVIRLCKALYEKGHEITIVTTPHRYGHKRSTKFEFADVYCLPIYEPYLSLKYNLKFVIMTILKVRELSKYKYFDIIHGHSGYMSPALITGASSKLSGVPSVHSVYCPANNENINMVAILSKSFLSRFYFTYVDKVIAVTENVAKSLRIPKEKIVVIPPMIDDSRFNSSISGDEIRVKFGLSSEPTLLYVGNLSKVKGLHVLLDALKLVKGYYPNIKLFMVLNMPLEKYENPDKMEIDMELILSVKEKIKNYGLSNNVIPIGLTDKMPEIIAASDIFVMPFLSTTGVADYPLSLLEAMAVGKPVITTKVGGVPEIIRNKENGLLINPGDPLELVNAILYMLENEEEARKMGKNGEKLVREMFSAGVVVNKIEKVYKSVGD